ncbi:permease prefix domain 1-containing protein [Agromyces arachidis]|uniref:permease prefix domain 1-containing protein n=1 Tax=Agromyces arachidis TaxID=766966 RepID=UPI004056A806
MSTPTATLTDRYVHAAVRTVPERQRADLDRELRERIGDEVDARVASGTARDRADAEVGALTALGDPERLAAGYLDRPLQLIGPRYYLDWLRLLKLLVAIIVPIAMGALLFARLIGGASVGEAVTDALATGVSIVVNLAFWVTLVFAIIERAPSRGPKADTWSPAQLPDLPRARQVSRADLIASVVFLVLAMVLLVWQQFSVPFPGGQATPVLNPDLWSFWLPYLIAILALEVGFWILLYRNGHWNAGFAAINVALNAAFAIPVVWLASTGRLFDPALFDELGWPEGILPGGVLTTIVVSATVVIAVWDSIDGGIKAWRARHDGLVAAG